LSDAKIKRLIGIAAAVPWGCCDIFDVDSRRVRFEFRL
jgi:hypothetical protein